MYAKKKHGLSELVDMITQILYASNKEVAFLIPYDKGQIVSRLCENAEVLVQNYIETGVYLVVNCQKEDRERYKEYIVEKQ